MAPLSIVEPVSIFIVGSMLALRLRTEGSSALGTIFAIGLAAWISEVTCIRWYTFYQYDAPWTAFIDVMPLLVVLIWPFVILSARDVLLAFGLRGRHLVAAMGCMVFYDASLVEPVAVASKLWSWNEPGVFSVPIIGILGWAIFTVWVAVGLEHQGLKRYAWIGFAPIGTHLSLLTCWWGGLRWGLREEIDPSFLSVISLSMGAVLAFWVRRSGVRAGLEVMLPRMAAAGLFFTLLWLRGGEMEGLLPYGVGFAIPYLAATQWRFAGSRPN